MVEFSDRAQITPPSDEWRALILHQSVYGDPRQYQTESARPDTIRPNNDQAQFDQPKPHGLATTPQDSLPQRQVTAKQEKTVNPEEEAGKIIDLAKERINTFDWPTGNPTSAGIAASKALANEVASLTRAQAADVNTAMLDLYHNIYPTWTPVPTGMVNEYGQSTGMEVRASKLDFLSVGPQNLQILDDGKTVTVRRQVAPAKVEDGKEIPAQWVVDAQAARTSG